MADTRAEILAVSAETPNRDGSSFHKLRPSGGARDFENVVAEHQERIAGLCNRLLGWREDVEDVVQDVFVATLRALPEFRGESALSTWLTRIAVNTCRSAGRKRATWLRWIRPLSASRGSESAAARQDSLGVDERNAEVRRAVADLPTKYREVVVLRYLEEIELAEIGQILGLSKNAVEVRLNRARARLRESLAGIVEV